MTTTNLISALENFDYFYEMSCDPRKWEAGNHQKKQIKTALQALTPDQVLELKEQLNVREDLLNRYWKEEFDVQPNEPTPSEAPTPSKDMSLVMRRAWEIQKRTSQSFSKCLKQSWSAYKLQAKMRQEPVSFQYRKKDGTVRMAKGTLKLETRLESKSKPNPKVLTYYDLEKSSWRCFRPENLISIAV